MISSSFDRDLPGDGRITRCVYCTPCGLRCDSEKERVDHVKEYGAKHNDFEIIEIVYNSDGDLVSMDKIESGIIQQLPPGVFVK